jgi:hypothetical protein
LAGIHPVFTAGSKIETGTPIKIIVAGIQTTTVLQASDAPFVIPIPLLITQILCLACRITVTRPHLKRFGALA